MHMAYCPDSSLLVVAVKVSHLLLTSQGHQRCAAAGLHMLLHHWQPDRIQCC